MKILFDQIPLKDMSVSMTMNGAVIPVLAMYIVAGEEQGAKISELSGTIQNDILKEFMVRNTYIYPPLPSMKIIGDIIEYTSKNMPRFNSISISGYHIREAGSTASQEIAFTLSNGKAYVKAALEKGLDIDVFGKRLSFFFNAHNDLFEEVAKFRAARKIWAKLMKDLGAKDPKAMMLRFHTQTGGSTLTAQQPLNNIARVTLQSLAAVLGGTQSLHTNGYDEALSLPTEEAARIALRTQQIIAFESGVTATADPLAGSYFVESLTDALEKEALRIMEHIDLMGGSVSAIEQGYMQEEIASSAYQFQQSLEKKEKIIVGVNQYQIEENEKIPLLRINESIRTQQIARIADLKARRDAGKAATCLEQIRNNAVDGINLMPSVLEAVENNCTLGEIATTLRGVFGEHQ
jgi:methylmalonyl-CoA mutase N-terminal domain/subunit